MSPLKEELCSRAFFFNDNVFFSLIVERKEDVTSCVTLIFNHMFLFLSISPIKSVLHVMAQRVLKGSGPVL